MIPTLPVLTHRERFLVRLASGRPRYVEPLEVRRAVFDVVLAPDDLEAHDEPRVVPLVQPVLGEHALSPEREPLVEDLHAQPRAQRLGTGETLPGGSGERVESVHGAEKVRG